MHIRMQINLTHTRSRAHNVCTCTGVRMQRGHRVGVGAPRKFAPEFLHAPLPPLFLPIRPASPVLSFLQHPPDRGWSTYKRLHIYRHILAPKESLIKNKNLPVFFRLLQNPRRPAPARIRSPRSCPTKVTEANNCSTRVHCMRRL